MTNKRLSASSTSLQPLADIVAGKSVALVGNAMSLLTEGKAHVIDSHDVVIRMNAGLPGILSYDKIGSKTTVWATAKHFGGTDPKPELMVFMKLTALGDLHWDLFQSEKTRRHHPMIRWTWGLEDEVKEFVGADPGTGIRLLYWLKRYASPKSIATFGFDCWTTLSSWSRKPNTPNHDPLKEKAAYLQLVSE